MRVSVLLFDGFTCLDVVGGYEVLAHVPGVALEVVAAKRGLIAADTRMLALPAGRTFAETETTEMVYVPGGPGVEMALRDEDLLACIRRLHERAQWTVGVCNGVEILAAAGILGGRTVTTNWGCRDRVAAYGVKVVRSRYHRDDKIVTAAGVSASIDMGLFLAGILAGENVARMIRLGLEYYPAPPFAGTSADDEPEPFKDAVLRSERASVERLKTTRPAPPERRSL